MFDRRYTIFMCLLVLNGLVSGQVAHELEQKTGVTQEQGDELIHQERELRRKSLLANPDLQVIGSPKVYRDEFLKAIDFTVGGLGTGCIRFDGEGKIAVWQMNSNHAQVDIPCSFFAVRTKSEKQGIATYALQTAVEGPFQALRGLEFQGEYPFGWYRFIDDTLPVEIRMEVYNPFIPLDEKNSGIPCAIINCSVTNPGPHAVDVSILAAQQNPLGFTGRILKSYGSFNGAFNERGVHKLRDVIQGRSHAEYGENRNTILDHDEVRTLHMKTEIPRDHEGYGDVTLTMKGEQWQFDGSASWDDLTRLQEQFAIQGKVKGSLAAGPSPEGQTLNGALSGSTTLQPGESRSLKLILCWYYPNAILGGAYSPNWSAPAWGGGGWGGKGSYYLNHWSDAQDVLNYILKHESLLEEQTKLYHRTFYQTNFPYWLKDRISSQTAVLKSLTCFWTREGYFGGWEGCGSTNGSCAGNCAHVWHYAQAHARLFPQTAKLMRQQELAVQKENGMVPYRQPNGHGSFDGQCGTVLGAYREHLNNGDISWLKKHYERVKKAADYLIATWDQDEDGQLKGGQHNTLDSSLSGNSSWMGSLYAAAMTAMAEMSALSKPEHAGRYREIAEKAILFHQAQLWNGEYFIQIPDPEKPLSDYANGCALDQMLGQWWAHQLNMGWIYDREKVHTAMASVFRNNFLANFFNITQKPREFVKNDEAGMQMIVWPNGGRPQKHTSYADEVMSGFEYSTAALMIKSELINEGLAVLKAVDDRYDGRLRTGYKGAWGNWGFSGNPYGDDECGKFYSRSLSIWSVLLLMQGFHYDGPAGVIGFDPAWQPENHTSFFTSANGWGLFRQERSDVRQINQIQLKYGNLDLKHIYLTIPTKETATQIRVKRNGHKLNFSSDASGKHLQLKLKETLQLRENEIVKVEMDLQPQP